MERLGHSDYKMLLDFSAQLLDRVPLPDFGDHVVRLVSGMFPGMTICYDQIDEHGGHYDFDHNAEIDDSEFGRFISRLQEVYTQNPIYGYLVGGGTGPLVDISELCSRRDLERTDFYQDIFRPYGIRHQVDVLLPREGWITTLTVNSNRPITGRMKTMLSLVMPHIRLAHRNACLDEALLGAAKESPVVAGLTPREQEVFHWLGQGKRNAEIAVILGCSPRTVDKHVENILRKTGAETRTGAVRNG